MGAPQVSLDQIVNNPVVQLVVFCPHVDGNIQVLKLFCDNLRSLFTIHFSMLRVQRMPGTVPVTSA